jgi:hypothetical protein
VDYRGCNLYRDVLLHVRDWQICASLDGTGLTGEYIRTGLDYSAFLENFQQGMAIAQHSRQMRIDFTLTLPGLFEVERMQELANKLGVDILAKVVFSFTPDIIMSPLSLPRELLDKTVDRLSSNLPPGALKDVLLQLKSRPTFAELWPTEWQSGLAKGKQRVLKLEQIRGDRHTLADIISSDNEIAKWYESIKT